jgi:hypothetical protein
MGRFIIYTWLAFREELGIFWSSGIYFLTFLSRIRVFLFLSRWLKSNLMSYLRYFIEAKKRLEKMSEWKMRPHETRKPPWKLLRVFSHATTESYKCSENVTKWKGDTDHIQWCNASWRHVSFLSFPFFVIFVLFFSSHISPLSFIHDMFTILILLRSTWCRIKEQEHWLYSQPWAMYSALLKETNMSSKYLACNLNNNEINWKYSNITLIT